MEKILSYPQWCGDMERFYDTMPSWYRSSTSRMAAYDAYHIATKLYNAKEADTKAWNEVERQFQTCVTRRLAS